MGGHDAPDVDSSDERDFRTQQVTEEHEWETLFGTHGPALLIAISAGLRSYPALRAVSLMVGRSTKELMPYVRQSQEAAECTRLLQAFANLEAAQARRRELRRIKKLRAQTPCPNWGRRKERPPVDPAQQPGDGGQS